MKICIICLKEKNDSAFNEEHVFPYALGGTLKVNNCCKECNSKMGSLIDDRLTNLQITEIVRFLLKIKGRSGVPNPFRKHLFDTPCKGVKGQLKFDRNGDYEKFEVLTKPIFNTEDSFIIAGDSNNIEKVVQSINSKIGKEKQKPFTKEELEENSTIIPLGKIKDIHFEITKEMENEYLLYIIPAIYKIAFEFIWTRLGDEYLYDETGSEIRKILNDISEQNIKESFDVPTSISIESLEWENIKRYHSAKLTVMNNKIICTLNILNFIKAEITMSEQAEIYKYIDENIFELNF